MASEVATQGEGPSGPPGSRGSRGLGDRVASFVDRHVVGVFVSPGVAFVVVMMAFPVAYTLYLSVHEWVGGIDQPPQFVGLDNFQRLLEDQRFLLALGRTFLFTGVAITFQTVLGVAIAVFLHREFRARGMIRSIMLMPMIATPVAIALIFRLMFQPQLGILNDILTSIGMPPLAWTSSASTALWSLAAVDVWEWTPLIALITLAGLSALPEEPLEAASVDGANGWQRFWFVILPMVRPVVIIAVVFRLIEALKTFDIILVITQGGPGFATETLNIYVYNTTFQYMRFGYSAAMLIVYFLVVLGCAVLLLRFRRAKD
ncbi:carbohydrate ABC transporter permease [Egibacter rhizosphaerae]|nr:sugar ABC transporter permease [Egibacter rhizosphaerae]